MPSGEDTQVTPYDASVRRDSRNHFWIRYAVGVALLFAGSVTVLAAAAGVVVLVASVAGNLADMDGRKNRLLRMNDLADVVALAAIVCVGLTAYNGHAQTQQEEILQQQSLAITEQSHQQVEEMHTLKEDAFDRSPAMDGYNSFEILGEPVTLPLSYADFVAKGFVVSDSLGEDYLINPDDSRYVQFYPAGTVKDEYGIQYADDCIGEVILENQSGEACGYQDCTVIGIRFRKDLTYIFGNDDVNRALDIRLFHGFDYSTRKEELFEVLGEPNSKYENEEYDAASYGWYADGSFYYVFSVDFSGDEVRDITVQAPYEIGEGN